MKKNPITVSDLNLVNLTYNGKIISFLLSSDVMVNATEMAKMFCNSKEEYLAKRPSRWLRTKEAQDYIHMLIDLFNINIKDIIITLRGGSNKEKGGSGTWMNYLLFIKYDNWISNDENISKFITKSFILLQQNNAPERCTYYGEEFIDFCYDFVDLVGEEELLKNFECFENKEFNYSYHKSNIGETTKFYIPLKDNKLIKLDKTDILGVISEFNSNIILKTIKYLDSILEKDDITYLRFKYLIMSQLNYTTFNKDKFITNQKTYLMKDSNTGYIKIGKAIDPKFRERTLQSEKPTISLLAICDNLVERELHKKYNVKRVRGEWFKLSEDEVSDIIKKYDFNLLYQ